MSADFEKEALDGLVFPSEEVLLTKEERQILNKPYHHLGAYRKTNNAQSRSVYPVASHPFHQFGIVAISTVTMVTSYP
jgi:hypothetical protein